MDTIYILWVVYGEVMPPIPMGFYAVLDDAAAQMYIFKDQIKEYGGIMHRGPFGGVRVVKDMFITETPVNDILKNKVVKMEDE